MTPSLILLHAASLRSDRNMSRFPSRCTQSLRSMQNDLERKIRWRRSLFWVINNSPPSTWRGTFYLTFDDEQYLPNLNVCIRYRRFIERLSSRCVTGVCCVQTLVLRFIVPKYLMKRFFIEVFRHAFCRVFRRNTTWQSNDESHSRIVLDLGKSNLHSICQHERREKQSNCQRWRAPRCEFYPRRCVRS